MATQNSLSGFDVVGSFLRPSSLKKARSDFEAGRITKEVLTETEDYAIRELVSKQKKTGLHFITDGEFRRATWHLDFMWAFNGVGHSRTETGLPFHGEAAMIDDTYLTGKVSVDTHPFVGHFRFVKALEDEHTAAKQTIPAPAQFLEQMIMPFAIENTRKYYKDTDELVQDIASGYKKIIRDLYDAGCRTIQFDDCSWGMLVDPRATSLFGTDLSGLKKIQEQLLAINNLAIEGKPDDLVINTHVCRGNFHSTYASSGSYDAVAEVLFAKENVHSYYLEFDDERSGGFAPLAKVSGDKKVVLGLVTTKSPVLENKDTVIRRIHEAGRYIPLERLSLSPQCGFASCEIGNKLTEEEQWAKVALVKEIAEEVWG
jgi:5-methyltetrahydropteroyltriglutamate--homocysteine methyltransferase